MTRTWRLVLIVLAATTLQAQRPASTDRWVATWASSQTLVRGTGLGGGRVTQAAAPAPSSPTPPAAPGTPARRFPIPPSLASVSNQSVRMIVRTSIGGTRIRIRLTDAFGAAPVAIGAARVARSTGGAAVDVASSRAVTFSGRKTATIYAGQMLFSDPIDLAAPPLTDFAVTLYLPGDTGPPTQHLFGLRSTYISAPGDFTDAPDFKEPAATTQSYYWLAGVDVASPVAAAAIVAFGDSITDGDQSSPEKLASWPAVLAARLQASRSTSHLAVVNAGISGNRILGDDGGGLVRLPRDVLSEPGVRWITLLEGINDITSGVRQQHATGAAFSADDLIVAYRQVIEQAHARGVRVVGCTLLPFGGSSAFSEDGERIRSAVNAWIRTGGAFDAIIDFDKAVRDPRDPLRLRPEADSPDLLHPGDAGYKLMADAIDLRIFTTPSAGIR